MARQRIQVSTARAIAAFVAVAIAIAVGVYLFVLRPPSRARPHGRDALAELRHADPAAIAGDLDPPDATAVVCARRGDELPRCATARGSYELAGLAPGPYAVWASAGGHASELQRVALAPGDRARVDLAIASGAAGGSADGARVHGVVRDVRGHAIAGATVHVTGGGAGSAAHDVTATSDADGVYLAYLPAGEVTAHASADDFVDDQASGFAPGELDLALEPAASLAGTVVDAATRAPVAGADVEAGGEHATTDAGGHFRIAKLRAGRYKPTATAFGGYGEADESVLVPLGRAVDGVVIAIAPRRRRQRARRARVGRRLPGRRRPGLATEVRRSHRVLRRHARRRARRARRRRARPLRRHRDVQGLGAAGAVR